MSPDQPPDPQDIRQFWFDAPPFRNRPKLWWKGGQKVDKEIESRFGPTVELALDRQLNRWSQRPDSLLSLILVCDQFTRNIYRGTPKAFSGDALALELTQKALANDWETTLHPLECAFLLMPLEHSEKLDHQKQAVAEFERLLDRTKENYNKSLEQTIESNLDFAQQHCDIIARFDRFPHRNEILGRESTPEEIAYLRDGGKRFGQQS